MMFPINERLSQFIVNNTITKYNTDIHPEVLIYLPTLIRGKAHRGTSDSSMVYAFFSDEYHATDKSCDVSGEQTLTLLISAYILLTKTLPMSVTKADLRESKPRQDGDNDSE